MSSHILSVIGARPQFVKAAAFSRACAAEGLRETIIHTGQHYDDALSELFFRDLGIPKPWTNLGVGSASAPRQIAETMWRLESAVDRMATRPDWVVVFGDTNSTLSAALAAVKKGLRVAHVEAGLRSFNRLMPEEQNRVIVDRIANVLFCPNQNAVSNLRAEGITNSVFEVGDVMYDALRMFAEHAIIEFDPARISGLSGAYYLATIHRAENTNDPQRLRSVLDCLGQAPGKIVWPIHPRTLKKISGYGLAVPHNIKLIDPVGYPAMLSLIAHAEFVLTDSGGVQREAYWLERPCITLRDETEWTETVHGNWNQLVGVDPEAFADAISKRPIGSRKLPSTEEFAGSRMVRILAQVN